MPIRLKTVFDSFLVKAAERIGFVFAKRRDALKTRALVQTDRGGLMNTRFKSEQRNAAIAGVVSEMIEHLFAVTRTAVLGAHVHAFEFAVFFAVELDASAADGCPVVPDEKERDALGEQLFDAIAMTALARIQRRKICLEFFNQGDGIRSIGTFLIDGNCHRFS
jgi:hypothetical protein